MYQRTTVDALMARVMLCFKSKTSFALATGNSHELENILSQSYGICFHFRTEGRQQKLDKTISPHSAFAYS